MNISPREQQTHTYLFSYTNAYSDIYETSYNMSFVFYDDQEASDDFAYTEPLHDYEGDFFRPH